MKLIVGLGNPGREYADNRHNIGFQCLDLLAARHQLSFDQRLAKAIVASGVIADERVILAKPQTFMNHSGESVSGLLRWFKLPPADLVVVCDDLDLPLGRIRIRERGGSGGHNGLKSIIGQLGTQDFARIRVGIGRPAGTHHEERVIGHVLGNFSPTEMPLVEDVRNRVADAIECLLREGIREAMNIYNGTP